MLCEIHLSLRPSLSFFLSRSLSFCEVSHKQQPPECGHSGSDAWAARQGLSKMCQCDASRSKARRQGSLSEAGKLFLKHTTFHGLRHIFLSGSYPRRIAWLLAFLAALALLVTWSSNRVRYLLSSPVYTKAHMVYAKRLVFPAVTICNQNLLLPRRMKKTDIFSAGRWLGVFGKNWQITPAARDALIPLRPDGDGSDAPWSPLSRILDFNHFLPPPRESQPSMRQLLDRLGHQLEEMLLYCRFQGELCGPRNFSTVSVSQNFTFWFKL